VTVFSRLQIRQFFVAEVIWRGEATVTRRAGRRVPVSVRSALTLPRYVERRRKGWKEELRVQPVIAGEARRGE
jgi:hypothetical protein